MSQILPWLFEPCLHFQVEYCRLPGLAVALTLDNAQDSTAQEGISDLVAFVSGLLLGSDITVRNWFAQFVRTGQKVRSTPVILLIKSLYSTSR